MARKISPYNRAIVHRFKRKEHGTFTVTYDGATQKSQEAYFFTLDSLPNYAEFTSLYDRYRIAGVKAQFFPRSNVLALTNMSGTLTGIPPLVVAVDNDDNTANDYEALMQYPNAKVYSEFKPFSLYFKVNALTEIYKSAVTTGYANVPRKTWLDAANPDIPHYGLKVASLPYSLANNTTEPIWDIVFTYYLHFRDPR